MSRTLTLSDGTRIAYAVHGVGEPAIVLSNGLTTSTVFWRHLLPEWSARHAVLVWDLPGHGASGPACSPASASIEGLAQIALQLMASERFEAAVQIGWSTGCQVVLELYRSAPERCLGLGLLLGAAGRVLDTTRLPLPGGVVAALARHAPPRMFATVFHSLSLGARTPFSHALGVRLGLVGETASRDDVRAVLEHIPTVDPRTLQWLLASLATHDARDVLATARVPALVVAGDRDPFAPAELVGLPLHRDAPTAKFLELPSGTHTALLDHAPEIAHAVRELLDASARRR